MRYKEYYGVHEFKNMEILWKNTFDVCRICLVPTTNGWYKLYCIWLTEPHESEDGYWEATESKVSKMWEADVVDFDGVRHLEFNRNGLDTDGYLYYPDMEDLVESLTFLRDFADIKLAEWEESIK